MGKRWVPALRYGCTILFGFLFIVLGNRIATGDLTLFKDGGGVQGITAKVLEITGVEQREGFAGLEIRTVHFEGIVTSGEFKGLLIEARQEEDPLSATPLREVRKGDRVLLYPMGYDEEGLTVWALQEYVRSNALAVLAVVLCLLLLLFGGKKGWNTIVSLGFTCLAIFTVLIPAILSGYNIYGASLAVCGSIIFMTLALVNGYNRKGFSAAVGCAGGLAGAGIALLLSNLSLKLTGVVDEESIFLLYINPDRPIDLRAIVFCTIILGALGATLDVAVSIASSLSEIAQTTGHSMGIREALRSGMNIGRDIMGTMANTLVLAYIGSSMSLVLLLIVYSNSLLELFNREVIVVEVLQSLVGSFGLLVTIPVTALAWALISAKQLQPNDTEQGGGEHV